MSYHTNYELEDAYEDINRYEELEKTPGFEAEAKFLEYASKFNYAQVCPQDIKDYFADYKYEGVTEDEIPVSDIVCDLLYGELATARDIIEDAEYAEWRQHVRDSAPIVL